MRTRGRWSSVLGMALGVTLVLEQVAWAQIGGGSSRIPLTDFLVELYTVTNNVYVPLLAAAAVVVGAANLIFGWMRMGAVMGRVILGVGLLGLGAVWLGQTVGGTVALGIIA